jgi:Zn/Cd-binding protein ZinT
MKVKVFQPNSQGKIEFTRAELEKLLNEVYDGGFRDGEAAQREKSTWTWTSPYRYSDSITLTNAANATNTIDNHTQPIDKLTCIYDSATNKNDTSIAKNATIDVAPISITLDNMDREAAVKHISDTVAALRRAQAAPGDVFTNLAKELNF